jgi:wyosine [tRNA(Phe)-imidazoG37] synthetase (radical SAM superfamily)
VHDLSKTMLFTALLQHAKAQQWQYLYPVYSRRAQGISLGINLHPNQACNWQCIYCQVSGLHLGASPVIDLEQLRSELSACLHWLQKQLAAQNLRMQDMVSDIAFAGDGESTTSPQFAHAMQLLAQMLVNLADKPRSVRLITNGSQIHHAHVQAALAVLDQMQGEVWFKLDAGNDADMYAINQCTLPVSLHLERLRKCSALCKTWVQTAVVSRHTEADKITTSPALPDYLNALAQVQSQIRGVLLYGISRPSQQPGAKYLLPLAQGVLEDYALAIEELGIPVQLYA